MREIKSHLALLLLALAPGLGCSEDSRAKAASASVSEATTAPAPCVYFRDLAPFLPESLEGFTHASTEGSTGKYGEVSVSEAERTFTKGEDREVKVRIVDTTLGGKIAKAIKAAAEDAKQRPQSDPTAPIFWDAAVGFVRYDASEATAEANLLVGDRFVVAVTSRGFPGTVEVRRVARGIDLAGLAQLR
ncbi:hypothetical protein [Hyalangium versicolor]|uniref:hypothetical protein n=1 Tax=Hyalangium versicolor TaxID=2861190 RepID=UPI001CC92371|nr:hypothetical protein [Hyalangium versicolor]